MIIFDLFPYIGLLFLTLLIPGLFNKKASVVLLFLLFFVFSGFRYGVGWDYFNYLEVLKEGDDAVERMEFLMRQLDIFCIKYGLTQFFFVATSFIMVLFCFIMFVKESENPIASIFVFLCVPSFFLFSLIEVRHYLMISMIFLSYHYGYKKQYIPYVALMIAAFFTHKAALFGLFTIPFVLLNIKFSLVTNLIIFITCFVIGNLLGSFSFISSLFDYIILLDMDTIAGTTRYLEDTGNANFSRTPYIFALINLINLFVFQKNNQIDTSHRIGHYVTMYNIGCSIMFLFSFNAIFSNRLSTFFTIFLTLIFPFYKPKPIPKLLLCTLFIFVFFFQLTIRASHPDFVGRQNCFLPYRMIFSF